MPFPIMANETLNGDTTGATDNDFSVPGCTTVGGLAAGDHVYAYTPATSGSVTLTLTPNAADMVLFVRERDCFDASEEIDCGNSAGAAGVETATFTGVAGHTYWIYVDGDDGAEGRLHADDVGRRR